MAFDTLYSNIYCLQLINLKIVVTEKPKKKKIVLKVEEPWTPLQKGIIAAMVSFVPFFFFIILPLLTRNYIITELKIAPNLLYSKPRPIPIVKVKEYSNLMRIRIRDFDVRVPRDFTPSFVSANSVIFKKSPRKLSRTLSFGSFPENPQVDLRSTGIIAWFVPSDMYRFLEDVLPATWHPARLLCKAHFMISQTITGQIFYTFIENTHKMFIFPMVGHTGYLGRIFPIEGQGYAEFSYYDEKDKLTLQEWIDIVYFLRPVSQQSKGHSFFQGVSVAEAMEKANRDFNAQSEALEIALNRYFATGSSTWLLPVAVVMENRSFFKEVMQLFKLFAPTTAKDIRIFNIWQEVLDRTVKRILKLDVDRHLQLNAMVVNALNLGDHPLKNIKIRVTLITRDGEKEFLGVLCEHYPLYPGNERTMLLKVPTHLSVNSAKDFKWSVEDIEVME